MTSGVHDMCGIASVVPQTVPNQIWDVFCCQNELCMKLPPHSLDLNLLYQTNFTVLLSTHSAAKQKQWCCSVLMDNDFLVMVCVINRIALNICMYVYI